MKIEKKDLGKGEMELLIEVPSEELKNSIERAVEKISNEVKIEGFRPGKATYEVLKQKMGEIAILEEAARIYIGKNLDKIINDNIERQVVGQPQINITKLAPENPLEFKVTCSLMPEVTLGKYKDLEIKKEKIEVKEKEIEKMLGELKEMRVKEVVSEKEIKEGDKAIFNINVFLDKVPVEGGQAKDTPIVIGKGHVVAGFDDKMIGAKKGDERKFQLHYPEDHYQKNLAGKMVDFEVKVKEVYQREMPELNDQFAEFFGLKKIEELKEDIKKTLEHEKEDKLVQKTDVEIIDKIINDSKFGDIPETVITHEGEVMMHELEHNLEQQNAKLEDYLASLNKSRQQLILDMMPDAIKRVKSALVMREISLAEKIQADEHDVEHEIKHILGHYPNNQEVEQRVKTAEYKNYIANSLTNRKVMMKLREWNVKGAPKAEDDNCEECNH